MKKDRPNINLKEKISEPEKIEAAPDISAAVDETIEYPVLPQPSKLFARSMTGLDPVPKPKFPEKTPEEMAEIMRRARKYIIPLPPRSTYD